MCLEQPNCPGQANLIKITDLTGAWASKQWLLRERAAGTGERGVNAGATLGFWASSNRAGGLGSWAIE